MAKTASTAAQGSDDKELIEMRKRYTRGREAVSTLYAAAVDDIKFVTIPGNQWDPILKARRKDRSMYEFPKLRLMVLGIINEIKQNRPQGKVRGTEDEDRGLAQIMQGLCRNIEAQSNAEQVYDIATEHSVKGGFGVWRVRTDYRDDDDFDQDIFISAIRNPFCVTFDPSANEIDKRDGRWAFVEEMVPEEVFTAEHPDKDLVDFFDDSACSGWHDKGQIKRAEYWRKVPEDRELWMLSSGAVIDPKALEVTEDEVTELGLTIDKRRTIKGHKVVMRLTNGREWLSDEFEFPCKWIPLIPVWGNIDNIDGEDYWMGAVRPAKDGQRLHNLHRTIAIEAAAKAPKAPFVVKKKYIEGHETMWQKANVEDYPYLLLNDQAPDTYTPERTRQAEIPSALIALANIDNDDMKAATGQYDASLGARSNETSGKAIGMRRAQGANATFNYLDNLVYAIRFTYEILVNMIPRVYDTQRVVRVLGEDGGEKWKTLYQEVTDPATGRKIVLNDISKGKYDVVMSTGPSYATQRMEAVDAFTQLAGQLGSAYPQLAPILAYFVIKNLDVPGSEELDSILHKVLVAQGIMPPKEGEEGPQPQQPDPHAMAQIRKLVADAAKSEASAAKTSAEAQVVLPEAMARIRQMMVDISDAELMHMIRSGTFVTAMQGNGPPQVFSPHEGTFLPAPNQAPQGAFSLPALPAPAMQTTG